LSPTSRGIDVNDESAAYGKADYFADVRKWSLDMLHAVQFQPHTEQKISLLRQLDQVKLREDVDESLLPAYAAALAYLTLKAKTLLLGQEPPEALTREQVTMLLKSSSLKEAFLENAISFDMFRELIHLQRKERTSETLERLARSGH